MSGSPNGRLKLIDRAKGDVGPDIVATRASPKLPVKAHEKIHFVEDIAVIPGVEKLNSGAMLLASADVPQLIDVPLKSPATR